MSAGQILAILVIDNFYTNSNLKCFKFNFYMSQSVGMVVIVVVVVGDGGDGGNGGDGGYFRSIQAIHFNSFCFNLCPSTIETFLINYKFSN